MICPDTLELMWQIFVRKARNKVSGTLGEATLVYDRFNRKKDISMCIKRPKWHIRPNKRLHLECCPAFENNKSK